MRPLLSAVLFATALLFGFAAFATTVVKLDFDQLTRHSDLIVIGHVVSVDAMVRKGRVYSSIDVRIDETLKGESRAKIEIIQIGGRTKELVTRAHGMPSFVVGEHVLLFLEKPESVSHYVVTGLAQGKKLLASTENGEVTLLDSREPLHTVEPVQLPTTETLRPAPVVKTLDQARARIEKLRAAP